MHNNGSFIFSKSLAFFISLDLTSNHRFIHNIDIYIKKKKILTKFENEPKRCTSGEKEKL